MKKLLVSVFLSVCLAVTVFAQQPTVPSQNTEAWFREVEQDTEQARGLKFKNPVTYKTMEKAELLQYIQKKFREEATAEELRNASRAFEMLGLLPKDYDIEKGMLDLLEEQVGAFYDLDTHTLYTFRDAPMGKNTQRILMSHELVHALQDQHFKLGENPAMKLKDNDDRQRALQAVVEGDASVAMQIVAMKRLDMSSAFSEMMEALNQKTEKLDAAPPFLRDSLIFPYGTGQKFVNALQAKGGNFDGVNQALKDPPSSTEQILHPEKYFDKDKRDDPREVDLPQLKSDKWKLLNSNVLGEFGMRLLFATNLAEKEAKQQPPNPLMKLLEPLRGSTVPAEGVAASEGWDGDRFHLYGFNGSSGAGKGPFALWWVSVWDSEEDAMEFTDALIKVFQKRFPDLQIAEDKQSKAITLDNKDWRIQLHRKGDKVSMVQAPPAQFAEFVKLVDKAAP